jgi:DnaJ homolog subfamily C member 2
MDIAGWWQERKWVVTCLCRRYIERFNAKLREKAKKDEVKRLKAFVETAFNQDPRMVRRRQAEKAAK